MELNLIREDKLKVLLTPFDMMKYELTCEKLDYDNTETRKAIWSILDHAKRETGFNAAIGKIRIDVYPEKSGGCTIYITKLKNGELASHETMNEQAEVKTVPPAGKTTAVYEFGSADDLIRVCRFLSHRGYEDESKAFFEFLEKGEIRYFLQIRESPTASLKKARYLRENLFIEEFGERVDSDESVLYLRERTSPICKENAVQTLAGLA